MKTSLYLFVLLLFIFACQTDLDKFLATNPARGYSPGDVDSVICNVDTVYVYDTLTIRDTVRLTDTVYSCPPTEDFFVGEFELAHASVGNCPPTVTMSFREADYWIEVGGEEYPLTVNGLYDLSNHKFCDGESRQIAVSRNVTGDRIMIEYPLNCGKIVGTYKRKLN